MWHTSTQDCAYMYICMSVCICIYIYIYIYIYNIYIYIYDPGSAAPRVGGRSLHPLSLKTVELSLWCLGSAGLLADLVRDFPGARLDVHLLDAVPVQSLRVSG